MVSDNKENFEKWKDDLERRWKETHPNDPQTLREQFDLRLKDAIIYWWDKLALTAIPETLTWGATCLEFAFADENVDTMMDFYSTHPNYEGDLELFVHQEWGFPVDILQQVRQHEFVLLAWERQNASQLHLDERGLGDDSPQEQWQKDNQYAWKRIREDVFAGNPDKQSIPYTFDRLTIAYETFAAAGLHGGLKFFAE